MAIKPVVVSKHSKGGLDDFLRFRLALVLAVEEEEGGGAILHRKELWMPLAFVG